MSNSAIEVTVYSDGSDQDGLDQVTKAFGHYDTNGVDYVTTNGDLDDSLREAEAKAADTEGKDLIVILTQDGSHDDRESAKRSFEALAADGNFVVVVSRNALTGDNAAFLTWADDKSPYAGSVDLLTLDQLPGTEVAKWAKTVVGATA
ncbi:MAG TPA: hypothetical protein VFT16_00235 [Candidatus Saccharimonadales bacterium]|nr:hypothetical protein [Candidatus Saccharimonadales bacterium]